TKVRLTVTAQNAFAANTITQSRSQSQSQSQLQLQAQHRNYSTGSSTNQSTATPATSGSILTTNHRNENPTPAWTRDDDKMLAVLRRKKSDLAQIQIYMPHQPIAVIEARLKELETKAKQKPTFQRWTAKEDEQLVRAVREFGLSNWSEISDVYFSSTERSRRSARSCQIRWKFLHPDSSSPLSPFLAAAAATTTATTAAEAAEAAVESTESAELGIGSGSGLGLGSGAYRTGPWSPEEVELLQELVNPNPTAEAPNDWNEISRAIGTRSALQCHSQFRTVLHSGTKGKWTVEEVNRLLEARELFGGDWQKVAKHVGTRAPGQVRQKWNQFSEDVLRRLQARRQRGKQGEEEEEEEGSKS
ncbi:DNA binding transcription coactivator transcription factor, partial [Gamsiella multidivaricata]